MMVCYQPFQTKEIMISSFCILYLAAHPFSDQFDTDKRLQSPASVREVMVPLEQVVKDLEQCSHVPFTVSRSIAQRKITLVFKNRPLNEAMKAMNTALFVEWVPFKNGYRLQLTDSAKDEERRQEIYDQHNAQSTIEHSLKRLSAYSNLSAHDLMEMSSNARTKLRNSDPRLLTDSDREQARDLGDMSWVSLAEPLGQNLPDSAKALAEGQSVVLTSDHLSGTVPMGLSSMLEMRSGTNTYACTSAQALVRFRPDLCELEALLVRRYPTNMAAAIAYPAKLDLRPSSSADQGPLERRLKQWAKPTDAKVLETAMAADGQLPDPGYRTIWGGTLSLAEHLAYVSDCTGVPVVADAFRRAVSIYARPHASSVGEYLEKMTAIPNNLESSMHFVRPGAVRTENGWLMVRHANYWRLDKSEIPESVLRPLEVKLGSGQDADIDDYAGIASQIMPLQQAGLDVHVTPTMRFSVYPLYNCFEPLKLWSNLAPVQKDAALNGGIAATDLSSAQLRQLDEVVWDQFWHASSAAALTVSCLTRTVDPTMTRIEFHKSQQSKEEVAAMLRQFPQLLMKVEDKNFFEFNLKMGTNPAMGFRFEMDKGVK